MVTLNSLRSDENLIWGKVLKDAYTLQLTEASLPHKQKRPTEILSRIKTAAYNGVNDVTTFFRCIYFNVGYAVVNCIVDQII